MRTHPLTELKSSRIAISLPVELYEGTAPREKWQDAHSPADGAKIVQVAISLPVELYEGTAPREKWQDAHTPADGAKIVQIVHFFRTPRTLVRK